ncbi:Type I Iterative Polyketide synthase (PKS) [Pleurotus pulmonarius]|nr:Type I Iterative Polyketide synthase (PKS) [Pleurotus pulmonarius]KAF4597122.1 Type I Iterative Polyketide synthase (PKS) [Pleurotus pulmonarius]
MSPAVTILDVPVFAGQGTTAANSPQTRQQALKDAASPAGSLLLSSCFETFHNELSTLTTEELASVDITLSEFANKNALLEVPSDKYSNNSLITGPTLFLIQSLRYLAFVEASGLENDSLTPFSDVLKGNLEHGLGVFGFSSGILPAVVVGSALSTITYISRAVEAYRLALWIGVRTQIYRAKHAASDPSSPWSLVFLGISKEATEEAIINFAKDNVAASLFVTAVMDDKCVTVSGHPDTLAAFASDLSTGAVVHKTSVDTLYHSPEHINGVRQEVLSDVARRDIKFPNYSDIIVPIRSTFTGGVLDKKVTDGTLVDAVLDMVLTQPVNWDLVVDGLVKSAPVDIPVRLLNVGPGTGLTRSMERSFPKDIVSSLDLTSVNNESSGEAKSKQEPIAIVGMAVNMPGARDASKLWELLEKGINTISEVPEHRFKVSDYNNPKDPNAKRRMAAHTGNFIDGVDEFDNKFFKISPREAKSMDPQQRVLLHTAYEALENSGYVPGATPTFDPETFGCYVGVATHDYLQSLRDDIDVYYSTGTLKAFLSGRISYAMQLSGPSIVLDTACSSSAVAVYQGCRALMNGDCNAAMVGGVNVIASPDMMIGLDRGHFLSPTGQCKAFDASADGYSRSEGCGIFVLKRLSDAIAENDNILGVIRGVEVNQSGLAHSITHPHAPTQATLFKRLLANTGTDPRSINVVEAHGTGTQAGDPNELESIRSIFAIDRSASNPLHITSVKANIGHLEAASGAAGLAKLLLMLRHRTIPKQISLKNLNPRIANLESDHTIIDREHAPWNPSHEGAPRVALLNNFGAAGSNTATLLEEHLAPEPLPHPEGLSFPFGLSAKTESALEELRSRYVSWLEGPESDSARFGDIAYTMTARRQVYSHRMAVQASSKAELIEKLSKVSPVEVREDSAQVVFVFSGQGGQYVGMGQTLYKTSPLFKKTVDECESILTSAGFTGVLPIINPGPEGSGLTQLEEFEANQAAIFALEYALAKVWISWGLKPVAVVGHSLGEYAALVTANVLSLKGALMIIASRVRLMLQKCAVETTGMIAINAGPAVVNEVLASSPSFSGLSVACLNSATDCVVSGPLEELKALKAHLDAEVHCKNVLLSVPFGYHSPAMAPLLDDLVLVAGRATIRPPTLPVISNVHGEVVLPGDTSVFSPEYFARHCAEPVQFEKGINSFTSLSEYAKVDAWIEIGPHTTTLPMLKCIASVPKDSLLLGSLRKNQDPWNTLANSLAQLYQSNVALSWRQVFSHLPSVGCIDLPLYPLARNKFWVAYKESDVPAPSQAVVVQPAPQADNLISEYAMLHAWAQYPSLANGNVAIFETPISQLADRIKGHSVGGMPLCPASVYLEQVLAGLQLAMRHLNQPYGKNHPVLRHIEFAKPLVYDPDVARVVIASITLNDGLGSFTVSSRAGSDVSVHVHGEYRFQPIADTTTKFSHSLPVIQRQMNAVLDPKNGEYPEVFNTRTAYEVIFPRVVDYAKEYHTMRTLTVDPSGMEGYADVKLPAGYHRGPYVAHPVFVDTLLHVAGFVANMQGGINDAYICSEVGTVKILADLVDNDAAYAVYCNNAWLADEGVMLTEAYAVKIGEPKRIVAHLKGMAFRRVRLNSLKKGLAMAAGKAPSPHAARAQIQPRAQPAPVRAAAAPAAAVNVPSIDIQSIVLKLVSETCDISAASLDVNTDLTSLGVDSLMSIEIFGKLEGAFPSATLDASALSHCTTVTEIVTEVTKSVPAGSSGAGSSNASPVLAPAAPVHPPASAHSPVVPTLDIQSEVLKIVSETCDISLSTLGVDTDLNALGVDSLMSIEIFGKLEALFPNVELNAEALSHCSSVADIVRELSASLSSSPAPASPPTAAPSQTAYESSVPSSPATLAVDVPSKLEPPRMSINSTSGPDVKQLLASVLDVSVREIRDDVNFDELGLDSLTSIEAIAAIKTEFGLDVPGDFFEQCATARAVEGYIAAQLRARA